MSRILVSAFIECVPKACARPRFNRAANRAHTSAPSRRAADVQAALLAPHTPREPLQGALEVSLTYYLPPPKGEPAHAYAFQAHTRKPDADNLAKLTLDVMSRLRFWFDDAQVSSLVAKKRWRPHSGVHVLITQDHTA